MKKYELTDETRVWEGRTLHRIRALIELELDTGDTVSRAIWADGLKMS